MPDYQSKADHISPGKVDLLVLSAPNRFLFIAPDAIRYGVAEGNYTRLHLLEGGAHLVSMKIKDVVAALKQWQAFVRIHHSHFVNVHHLQHIDTQDGWKAVIHGETSLPVSNARRKELMAVFHRLYGRSNL